MSKGFENRWIYNIITHPSWLLSKVSDVSRHLSAALLLMCPLMLSCLAIWILWQLCPLYPHNPEVLLNELKSPSDLLDFGEFSDCMDFRSDNGSPLLHVVNPTFDYVPPKLVSLFITDTGGHNPSYMYRLIADYYSADDLVVRRRPASRSWGLAPSISTICWETILTISVKWKLVPNNQLTRKQEILISILGESCYITINEVR